jgi:hypothetical protein
LLGLLGAVVDEEPDGLVSVGLVSVGLASAGFASAGLAGVGLPGVGWAPDLSGAAGPPGLAPVPGRAEDPPDGDPEEPEPPWLGRPELSRDVLSTTRRS